MLSSNLVELIEHHCSEIAGRIAQEIQHDRRLPHIGKLAEGEVRDRCGDIMKRLSHWLITASQPEMARHFEQIGAERYEESVPLREVVLAYLIVKRRMIDFVREQGIAQTMVAVYAEEELEHAVDRFFDGIIYHMVKGYEQSLEHAAEARAHAAGR